MTKIARLRLKAGLSQEAAARKIDISLPMWQKVEAGTRRPSLIVAYKMAHLLGTTIEDAFSDWLQE